MVSVQKVSKPKKRAKAKSSELKKRAKAKSSEPKKAKSSEPKKVKAKSSKPKKVKAKSSKPKKVKAKSSKPKAVKKPITKSTEPKKAKAKPSEPKKAKSSKPKAVKKPITKSTEPKKAKAKPSEPKKAKSSKPKAVKKPITKSTEPKKAKSKPSPPKKPTTKPSPPKQTQKPKKMKAKPIQPKQTMQTLELKKLARQKLAQPILEKARLQKGTHAAFRVVDANGRIWFIKENMDARKPETLAEICASQMAAYLTDGRVPPTFQLDQHRVAQPFVPVDAAETKRIFRTGFKPTAMNDRQVEELFAHMVADYLIRNYDTHTAQFEVDMSDNIIGVDKAHAWRWESDFGKKSRQFRQPERFNPLISWEPLHSDEKTYVIFAKWLLHHPDIVKRCIASKPVERLMNKAQAMTVPHFEFIMAPYFDVAIARDKSQFYHDEVERYHSVKADVLKFFKLE